MTEADRQAICTRIEQQIAEIDDTLRSAREHARPVSLDDPIGRLSRMDAMQQQEMDQARVRMAEQRRRALVAALARLDDENFGECQDCGEAIAPGRLMARPEVTLCTACQRLRE